jgi:hypothetical protein
VDNDGDGMGEPGSSEFVSDGPDNGWDCDDNDSAEPQVADLSSLSGSSDGSLDYPWLAVQDAIDSAITGLDGSSATTIEASGLGVAAITMNRGEFGVVIDGLTITGGDGNPSKTSTRSSCTSTDTSWPPDVVTKV